MANDPTLRQAKLPVVVIESVKRGAISHTGHCFAADIAGVDVIVMANKISDLDIVYNKLNPAGTLRTASCPEIAIVRMANVTLDEEL